MRGAGTAGIAVSAIVTSTFIPYVSAAEGHPHASLLSGDLDPVQYNPDNPLLLIIIQLAIIIALSRVLAWPLSKIRQPRVLSEILAGVLLGPTAMGRVPGFTQKIFPPASIPSLNLLSTLGLSLFLFVVGLEVDFALFKRNLKPCLAVSLAGIAIPFGLGCALSNGLYSEFIDKSVPFVNFMVFIGTASSITAFPVLARILAELRLMDDNIGIIVLASGVCNDVLGWILLALSVALSSSGEGQIVVYILLCGIGYVLFLWFIIRPAFSWLGRRDGSFDGHPTQTYMCAILLTVLASYWVTEQIGISGLLGVFLCGLILENGLGKVITEKIEDLVITILVPLYFATSGLKTNLGLLNSGIIWAYVVCVMVVAFCGKFFGCAGAAKVCGFSWRESGAVGSLMASKGLIELVVLNVGLQVGVINTTVFSIFVLEALVLTFAATPLTLVFYPLHLRKQASPTTSPVARGVADRKAGDDNSDTSSSQKYTIVLDRFENLAALLVFSRLVATPPKFTPSPQTTVVGSPTSTLVLSGEEKDGNHHDASFNAIRLVEMTDRTSAVMHAADTDDLLRRDPLMTLYSTFANLNGLRIASSSLSVVEQHLYAETVASKAKHSRSDLILVPWKLSRPGEETALASYIPNPFESLFGKTSNEPTHLTNTNFLRDLYASASSDVAVFLDRGDAVPQDALPGHYHLFLPYHGGSDDRACLDLVTRLARGNRGVSVTVLIVTRNGEPTEEDRELDNAVSRIDSKEANTSTSGPAQAIEYTIHGGHTHASTMTSPRAQDTLYPTQHGLESETADAVALEQAKIQAIGLSVSFIEISTSRPLRAVTRRASNLASSTAAQSRFVWVVGRGRRDAASHRAEGLELLREAEQARRLGVCASAEARRCFGEGGVAALLSGIGSNVLVVQSRTTGGRRETRQV